jgi:hypothetical protein
LLAVELFIGNELIIYQNNSIIDLTGLENVLTVDNTVMISDNQSLTSLSGLNNLYTINKHLYIEKIHALLIY